MSVTVRLEVHGAVGVIVIHRPPVNAVSIDVRRDLCDVLDSASRNPSIMALVLACNGTTFVAGAEITEFGRPALEPTLGEVCERLERCSQPVVAALHGTVLGGGLELALACRGRVALASTKLGLPETRLGLIPGAGGTQRLPRLVGLARAFEMIVGGEPIDAIDALNCGLIDEVVLGVTRERHSALATGALNSGLVDELVHAELRDRAIALAIDLARRGSSRPIRDRVVAPESIPDGGLDALRREARQRAKGVVAVERAADALAASLCKFEVGLARERSIFTELRAHPQSRALRHLFAAERAAGKRAVAANLVTSVAVVGSGTMGVGIAISALDAGLSVTLIDVDSAALKRAETRVQEHYDRLTAKGRLATATSQNRRARLQLASENDAAAGCDLAIEAVVEEMAVKERVFATLDRVLASHAVLASNTSYLDVATLARATQRPHSVIGLHFFSPAQVMPLVEVVNTGLCDESAIATGLAFVRRLGKQPVVVGHAPGFVGNAMFLAYGRESQRLQLEGALPWQVDRALERWGMAMGPNAALDLAGLDVGYRARRERSDLPDDPTFFRVADALVEAGRFGQKSCAGHYLYQPGRRAGMEDPDVVALLERESRQLGIVRRDISDEEIVERCILALVNEGHWLLHRGVAGSAGDIDVIWTRGYGFPRWRGGPMYWADVQGLAAVAHRIDELAHVHGSQDWQRAPSLCDAQGVGSRVALRRPE